MCKFLIVEDSPVVSDVIASHIEEEGYDHDMAETAIEAIEKIKMNGINCMLLDINLRGGDGYDVLSYMYNSGVFIPTIIITDGSFTAPRGASGCGVMGMYRKPINMDALMDDLRKVVVTSEDLLDIQVATAELRESRVTLEGRISALLERE